MLLVKMNQYITKYSLERLSQKTGIDTKVLQSILEEKQTRYRHYTVNALYDFFEMPKKDNFYKRHLISWQPKTNSIIWSYFRIKRIENGKSLEEIWKQCNISTRALHRLEAGETLPWINSWTVQKLFENLDFKEEEKERIWSLLKLSYQVNKELKKKFEV